MTAHGPCLACGTVLVVEAGLVTGHAGRDGACPGAGMPAGPADGSPSLDRVVVDDAPPDPVERARRAAGLERVAAAWDETATVNARAATLIRRYVRDLERLRSGAPEGVLDTQSRTLAARLAERERCAAEARENAAIYRRDARDALRR